MSTPWHLEGMLGTHGHPSFSCIDQVATTSPANAVGVRNPLHFIPGDARAAVTGGQAGAFEQRCVDINNYITVVNHSQSLFYNH